MSCVGTTRPGFFSRDETQTYCKSEIRISLLASSLTNNWWHWSDRARKPRVCVKVSHANACVSFFITPILAVLPFLFCSVFLNICIAASLYPFCCCRLLRIFPRNTRTDLSILWAKLTLFRKSLFISSVMCCHIDWQRSKELIFIHGVQSNTSRSQRTWKYIYIKMF